MRKKTLRKDIMKSIHHSLGRFFSIMMLMALGSFALVGLFVAGPDMRETGKQYFKELDVADITIISDYGIDESEQNAIQKATNIKDLEYIYFKDVTIKDTNESFRIFSKPSKISLYEVVDGKLPIEDNEIAIDNEYKNDYKIGDTIFFKEKLNNEEDESTLKLHEFKIVGFINSGEILSTLNRGQTTVGTGELNGIAIVNETVFNSEVYMMAKITFNDTANLDPYTDEYNDIIQIHKDELSQLLKEQQNDRFLSIKTEYQTEIDDGRKELDDAKQELEDARTKLNDAKQDLADAKIEISKNETKLADAKSQIDSATIQISENESLLNQKQSEYDSNANQFTQKQNEYNSAISQFSQKQNEYNSKIAELNEKKKVLESAETEINQSQTELNTQKKTLEDGKLQYENGISELKTIIENLTLGLSNPEITDEMKVELEKNLVDAQNKLKETEIEYNTFLETVYTPNIAIITTYQQELDIKKTEFEKSKTELLEAEKALEKAKLELDAVNNQLSLAKKELDSGLNQLQSAKAQLDDNRNKLNNAKSELENAKTEYSSGIQKLNDAKSELKSKESEYNDKLKEFQDEEPDALAEIAENEEKLNDAQEELDKLELPTYSVSNRRESLGSEGYSIYGTVAEIIDSLAKVFPIFLYFVAALVTLATMARFVSEERINMGTLKALGYSDSDIIKKFVIYGFLAGMIGTIIGIILGHTLLPYIVYSAYSTGFSIPQIQFHFHPEITIIAIILSLISSVLPAYVVARSDLKEKPSVLLLPKAPKAGSKILLEYIKPIWNKMSFTHKVTARNIFRYKQRMLMTIFGVAGSSALLFTGFSVQSSISGINQRQFEEIIKYDIIVAQNEDLEAEEQNELNSLLESEEINSSSSIYYEEVTKVAGKNNDRQSITLIVPENEDDFTNYISLIDRESKEKIDFSSDGVIITERLADLLNVSIGDTITFIDSKDKERTVKVSNICEMYAGHFMFMNKVEYERIYNKIFEYNSKLILLKDSSIENTKIQASKFMELSSVKGVVQNTTLYNQIETIVESLNMIMKVLILVAGMLAIVILYNLTNINVAERIRELSTIKVLGFFDKEVTMYIYRETIILSIIGIIFGWGFGIFLHNYILNVVPPDNVMFNPVIWIGAYIIPLITVSLITLILKIYVNNKLKNVDMLEALKSVD